MKSILFISIFLTSTTFTQVLAQKLPDFLLGTWKVENKETYEHWDKINDNNLKGFSYKIKDGKMVVTEYLEIKRIDKDVIYTVTVLKQNQGIGIDFKLTQSDSLYSFENPGHDFPKFIRYQSISENKMTATVGNDEDSFILIFHKIK
jgi:hypothetical protein